MQPKTAATPEPTRRDFVKTTTAVAVAATAAMVIPHGVYAAEDNTIKIGLVGCGGRGTGAANNAMNADDNAKLWAMGDMFPDALQTSLKNIKLERGDQVDVPKERQFTGWDAYKGVIETCDVVLLATPPHFRPLQLEAVIKAGKHCFCEKPVGVDAPSVKKVMEISRAAKDKNVSLVSGLCYRYDESKINIIKKIHDGAIGDIRVLQHNYLSGGLWTKPRKEEWTDLEYQIRNWLYFYWLSGDHIVEQHIHSIDKMMWIMKDVPPLKVMATGGRIQRTAPQYGNVYDHFNTIFEWENGTRAFTNCRQFTNCGTDISDWAFGVDGVACVGAEKPYITGKNPEKFKKSRQIHYDAEHVALFKSIRKNEPINNGNYMCQSTLAAIMARQSAYTGKEVTWQEILASTDSFIPDKYVWGPRVVDPIVVPGSGAPMGKQVGGHA